MMPREYYKVDEVKLKDFSKDLNKFNLGTTSNRTTYKWRAELLEVSGLG